MVSLSHQKFWLQVLNEKQIGVVAHFYMDPLVQGVLTAAKKDWPHIHISDSLVMADSAVKMAEGGCEAIAVLGVDFMSENVRAILDEAGYSNVKVCFLNYTSMASGHTTLMSRCLISIAISYKCILSNRGRAKASITHKA